MTSSLIWLSKKAQLRGSSHLPTIKCTNIVHFVLHFDLKLSGNYFALQTDSKFWSDCCIFHSLIPSNASLPSLIHLCQRLNPVRSDTRACGWEQVCGISDGGTGPLGVSDLQMWHAYEWSPKYWTLEEDPHLFTVCFLSSMNKGSIFCLSLLFFSFSLPAIFFLSTYCF